MAARPWFRLRSTVGQAPPPPPPVQAPRPEAQAETQPPAPPRPAFGRALTFRPTVVSGQSETIPPPRPPPPPPAAKSPTSPPSPVSPPRTTVAVRPSPPRTATPSPRSITSPLQTPSPPPPPVAAAKRSPTVPVPPASPITKTSFPSPVPSPPPVQKSPTPRRVASSPTTSQAPTAKPPSPLALPPSHYKSEAEGAGETEIPEEAEQKTVLVQEPVGKPKLVSFFKSPSGRQSDARDDEARKPTKKLDEAISKDVGTNKKEKTKSGTKKKASVPDSERDAGVRIITIAGDNKGAIMEFGSSPPSGTSQARQHELWKKSSLFKGNGSEKGEEEKIKQQQHKGNGKDQKMPMKAFVNSNVQGVNNSILYNTRCSLNDPGVHLTLTRTPANGGHAFGFKQQHGDDHGHHYTS